MALRSSSSPAFFAISICSAVDLLLERERNQNGGSCAALGSALVSCARCFLWGFFRSKSIKSWLWEELIGAESFFTEAV